MEIDILYCPAAEFRQEAAGLADEIHRSLKNVITGLIPCSDGIFDVIVDGEKVFSRAQTGRLPRPGEIVALLKREAS